MTDELWKLIKKSANEEYGTSLSDTEKALRLAKKQFGTSPYGIVGTTGNVVGTTLDGMSMMTPMDMVYVAPAFEQLYCGTKGLNYVDDATRISVDTKLKDYLLNLDHPVGGSKAKWFKESLGFTLENADDLAKQIVFDSNKAVQTTITEFGVKYNQVISIKGANGKVIDTISVNTFP